MKSNRLIKPPICSAEQPHGSMYPSCWPETIKTAAGLFSSAISLSIGEAVSGTASFPGAAEALPVDRGFGRCRRRSGVAGRIGRAADVRQDQRVTLKRRALHRVMPRGESRICLSFAIVLRQNPLAQAEVEFVIDDPHGDFDLGRPGVVGLEDDLVLDIRGRRIQAERPRSAGISLSGSVRHKARS